MVRAMGLVAIYADNDNKIGFIPVDVHDAYFDLCSDGRMFDAILCAEGYFGAMPKELPSKSEGGVGVCLIFDK